MKECERPSKEPQVFFGGGKIMDEQCSAAFNSVVVSNMHL